MTTPASYTYGGDYVANYPPMFGLVIQTVGSSFAHHLKLNLWRQCFVQEIGYRFVNRYPAAYLHRHLRLRHIDGFQHIQNLLCHFLGAEAVLSFDDCAVSYGGNAEDLPRVHADHDRFIGFLAQKELYDLAAQDFGFGLVVEGEDFWVVNFGFLLFGGYDYAGFGGDGLPWDEADEGDAAASEFFDD